MSVTQIKTGHFIGEKEVLSVVLTNDKNTTVKIFNYGTIIQEFTVKNAQGDFQDIVLGFDNFEGYISKAYLANYPYFGAIIGRYANRIKNGKLSIDGNEYQLNKNNGNDCLHGGITGFDRKIWDIINIDDSRNSVTFQYYSLDGEENFPGDLAIQLTFELTENNELILTYQADTDEATAINLTHHSYFNLALNGGPIKDHVHQMAASHYLEQDDNYVVTGKLIPVENTHYDFTKGKKIGENWDDINGYDQTYVLDKDYASLTLASKTTETNSGLSLLIYSTEPVAHLYTSKYLSVENGKGGRTYKPFDAFCVETQHHPNAINIPEFPSTILRPEEIYTQSTIYKILTK